MKRVKMVDMVVAMYGDFALYGASRHPNANHPRFWGIDSDEPFALFYARVPDGERLGYDEHDPTLTEALENHGTGMQWFDDGYEG
jgi:hypothetical protein